MKEWDTMITFTDKFLPRENLMVKPWLLDWMIASLGSRGRYHSMTTDKLLAALLMSPVPLLSITPESWNGEYVLLAMIMFDTHIEGKLLQV